MTSFEASPLASYIIEDLITYLEETERCSGLSPNMGDVALIMDITCGFGLMFLFICVAPAKC